MAAAAARACPAAVSRSESVVPDLSSASERVSEIVSTAMLSGMNCFVLSVDDMIKSLCPQVRRHPEVLAVLHGEPRRMGHKRPRPSFETPRKGAAPQDDGWCMRVSLAFSSRGLTA